MNLRTPDFLHHNDRVLQANAEQALDAFFAAQALVCGTVLSASVKERERRFESVWQIRNDRLYLMKFDPLSPTDAADTPFSLTRFGADGVLAEWLTGSIYVDDANVNVHGDDACILTEHPVVVLEFERGILGLIRCCPAHENINRSNAGH